MLLKTLANQEKLIGRLPKEEGWEPESKRWEKQHTNQTEHMNNHELHHSVGPLGRVQMV